MFPGAEFLLKTLSPRKGLELLRIHLQKGFPKTTIGNYDIIFDAIEKKVSFTVYNEKYEGGKKDFPFAGGEKFVNVALGLISEKIPKGSEIHKAVVQYTDTEITGFLFFEHEGKKQSLKQIF